MCIKSTEIGPELPVRLHIDAVEVVDLALLGLSTPKCVGMNEVAVLFTPFSEDLDCWNEKSARQGERQMPHLYPVAGPQQEHPGSV